MKCQRNVPKKSQRSHKKSQKIHRKVAERAGVCACGRAGERAGVCVGERAGERAGVSLCEGALRGGMSLTFL